MKMADGPLIDVQVKAELVSLVSSGMDKEGLMRAMRERGLSKIESMRMLRDHGGMTLRDAKRIVHLSSAWADRKEVDEVFHGAAECAAREDGFVQDAADAVKRPA